MWLVDQVERVPGKRRNLVISAVKTLSFIALSLTLVVLLWQVRHLYQQHLKLGRIQDNTLEVSFFTAQIKYR